MMKWATWMPWGPSSRGRLCDRPRSANLPSGESRRLGIALHAGRAPVNSSAPRPFGTIALDRGLRHQEKPPKAETAIDFSTSAGSSSINGRGRGSSDCRHRRQGAGFGIQRG